LRLAVISDVHGNGLALDAVLAEIDREGIDRIVCLGDVAVGPMGREVVASIRELGCPVIMGNWDDAYVTGFMTPSADETAAIVNEIHAWWGEKLTRDDRAWLQTLVPTLELELDGTPALCFHGSPRSYDEWVFATTPDDELEPMFAAARPPLLIGGHTHVQMLRRWHECLIVNPGAVGLPFFAWWPSRVRIAPWAEYAIVSAEAGRLQVDLRRTSYDVAGFLQLARASGMPHAQWWADCWAVEAAAVG
jgi:predicted phosphodiesterase